MDVLQKFSMQECHGDFTPLSSTSSLRLNNGSSSTDASQYRSAIGKLQYLAFTRPDICFAVNKLSQFMHQPSHTHWKAVKRILWYLKSTIHHERLFRRDSTTTINVYPDADWAGDQDDRTSTSAYVIYLGWSSKKHRTVARSSTEAEYRAVAKTSWLTNLFKELRISLEDVPTI
ncbi:PREDICTED: uncharacterized protein LOC109221962 [Nicotiana attenuata]|uniref:uncharacterized protein LOC109221962 n=1 Tax=Nicotiana attenuata TaxID=49451 RepID=UPI000904BE44|nr:PREDICTED: uncharacterized protein LOC109221962 [Nicotiana attenuata]